MCPTVYKNQYLSRILIGLIHNTILVVWWFRQPIDLKYVVESSESPISSVKASSTHRKSLIKLMCCEEVMGEKGFSLSRSGIISSLKS